MTQSDEVLRQADVTNEFDSWSALKLILHSAAVNMYTTVLGNNSNFEDLYYIDALAGSGVSMFDDGQAFLGSPIVAARAARSPFKKMYFIELEDEKAEALRTRLEFVFSSSDFDIKEPDDWEVHTGDANDQIPKIVREIFDNSSGSRGFNYYCFIDNQGLNVTWDTIEELTPKPYGDLLINLPTASGIGRNAVPSNIRSLNDFYGRDLTDIDLPNKNRREYMRDLYLKQLKEQNRSVQCSTRIDANIGSYFYDLVYATRDIDGGNGYMKVIEYVKEFIEAVHAGDVDRELEIITGGQERLQAFAPENEDVGEQIPTNDPNDEVPDNQSGLDDFW
jgi:three-Cys-motif partner protein